MTESEKPPAVLKKRKLSSKQWQQPKTALGKLGEDQAVAYLLSKKYRIKARNVLTQSGEIDIVAFDSQYHELVFCEVKTRTHTHFGHPSHAWSWRKSQASRFAAAQYLQHHPSAFDIRFDLVIVTLTSIKHYKNVTL